jgi:hypothetical protein
MTLVMLAMGTGLSPPTLPRLPTPSIDSAADPVVGQGNEGDVPGKWIDVKPAGWKAAAGIGRDHWKPAPTPTATTNKTHNDRRTYFRRRRGLADVVVDWAGTTVFVSIFVRPERSSRSLDRRRRL